LIAQQATAWNPPPAPLTASAPPPEFATTFRNLLGVDPDPQDVNMMWQLMQSGNSAQVQQELQAVRQAVQQTMQQQSVQQNQQRMGTLLSTHYPELAQREHPVTLATAERYAQLVADPAMQSIYHPDPQAVVIDPTSGSQYDMRLLMQAAADARAQVATAQARQSFQNHMPTLGTSVQAAAPPRGDMVPRDYIEPGGLLADPQFMEASQRAGIGRSHREMTRNYMSHVPADTRAEWQSRLPQTYGGRGA
jgi:hypothetical protein